MGQENVGGMSDKDWGRRDKATQAVLAHLGPVLALATTEIQKIEGVEDVQLFSCTSPHQLEITNALSVRFQGRNLWLAPTGPVGEVMGNSISPVIDPTTPEAARMHVALVSKLSEFQKKFGVVKVAIAEEADERQ